jgi:cytochrome c-type biogenesis protein CcmH/NrfG
MRAQADLAYRQSFVLCPTNPEVAFGYAELLLQSGRVDDALLMVRTAAKLKPADVQLKQLGLELARLKQDAPFR